MRKPAHCSANVRYVARVKPERRTETPEELQVRTLKGIRVSLILIAAIAIAMFLHYAKDCLIPVVAALVIAACLTPLCDNVSSLRGTARLLGD